MNLPMSTRSTAIRTATLLALTLCASAQAQKVPKCAVDARRALQSPPCPAEARVVASTAAAPKKRTLAELLRERDGGNRVRPPPRDLPIDGASVLRSRMGAV